MSRPVPESSFIRGRSLALAHRYVPDAKYMVMTAYYDESGTHGAESPVTIVAGFGGTVAQWVGMEKRLGKLFGDFGVKTFHAKDFRQRKGDFKDWDAPTKARFNSRFIQIMDNQLGFGIAGIAASADYRAFYRDKPFPRKVRPDTEYGICFRAALLRSVKFIKEQSPDWPLNVVLELGHKNQADAVRIFGDVKTRLNPKLRGALGTISFASKTDCQFLAVADSLAYNLFRRTAGFSNHPNRPDAVPTGPANPPYYSHKIPIVHLTLTERNFATLHRDHCSV